MRAAIAHLVSTSTPLVHSHGRIAQADIFTRKRRASLRAFVFGPSERLTPDVQPDSLLRRRVGGLLRFQPLAGLFGSLLQFFLQLLLLLLEHLRVSRRTVIGLAEIGER